MFVTQKGIGTETREDIVREWIEGAVQWRSHKTGIRRKARVEQKDKTLTMRLGKVTEI